ncbi:MAG: polysaccharide biosynthesis C-terminal domain-containing protein [Methylococcaceae bacterium]
MNLRKLVGQTAIYGLSSIMGRVLNYLLTPLYTYTFSTGEYGVLSEFYAYAGFISIVLVMGLETGFFRYHAREGYSGNQVYATAVGTLFIVCVAFVGSIVVWQQPLALWIHHETHTEYLVWFALILTLDTLTALPLARLRAQNRAWRFAVIKLLEIATGLLLNLYFLLYLPNHPLTWTEASLSLAYDPAVGVGYIFLANLVASLFRTLILLPEFRISIKEIQTRVLVALLRYSLPMIVIGAAGMVNEMLDRAILKYLLPYDSATNLQQLGIYAACYKLAMLMTLFVQAFRYAGEPFFFAQARRTDAPILYARVMRYFVLFGIFIFLVVTLYLDGFQYFIGESYRQGLSVVPVLLIANLLLGIHVNLSVWYKLTDKTFMGAWVAVLGAMITIVLNIELIPIWGYQGSAWATLICYAVMVLISGWLSRRYYPVPYPVGAILAYFGLGLGLFCINSLPAYKHALPFWGGSVLLLGFLATVAMFEIKPIRRVLLRF